MIFVFLSIAAAITFHLILCETRELPPLYTDKKNRFVKHDYLARLVKEVKEAEQMEIAAKDKEVEEQVLKILEANVEEIDEISQDSLITAKSGQGVAKINDITAYATKKINLIPKKDRLITEEPIIQKKDETVAVVSKKKKENLALKGVATTAVPKIVKKNTIFNTFAHRTSNFTAGKILPKLDETLIKTMMTETKQLEFDKTGGVQKIKMTNNGDRKLVIKAKCTDNNVFEVNSVFTIVEPGQTIEINVRRLPEPAKPDKIVFEWLPFEKEEENLAALFKKNLPFGKKEFPVIMKLT